MHPSAFHTFTQETQKQKCFCVFFCDSFDIDVVEKANTTIFNTIDSLGLRKINNPALRVRVDALDGSYCYLLFTLYNEAVNTNGLKFNERLGQKKELV